MNPGASFTVWCPDDWQVELLPEHNPIKSVQLGGQLIESSLEATIAIKLLPPSVLQEMSNEYVFPTLKNYSITSLGKMYNAGCEVLLT